MMNLTVLEWLGCLIPLKFLDKHHIRPVCCGHTIVGRIPDCVGTYVTQISLGYNYKQYIPNDLWNRFKLKIESYSSQFSNSKDYFHWTQVFVLYSFTIQGVSTSVTLRITDKHMDNTAVFSYRFLINNYATSFKVNIQFDHFRS